MPLGLGHHGEKHGDNRRMSVSSESAPWLRVPRHAGAIDIIKHKLILLLCVGKLADDGGADQAQGDDETGQEHKQPSLNNSLIQP